MLQWSRLQSEAVISSSRLSTSISLRLQWSRLQSEAVMEGLIMMTTTSFELQWSRLQSEAVIPAAGPGHAIHGGASMEPPPIGGGNLHGAVPLCALPWLQWSRLQSEAVILGLPGASPWSVQLQWSRLQSEAVMKCRSTVSMSRRPLQWSRLQSEAVMSLTSKDFTWTNSGFNGAASNRRR